MTYTSHKRLVIFEFWVNFRMHLKCTATYTG